MVNPVNRIEEESNYGCKLNLQQVVNDQKDKVVYNPGGDVTEEDKPKRGRPRKSEAVNMTKADSHEDKYAKTNALLDQTIYEIDDLNSGIKKELKAVIASKTLKKKYEYMSELASTSGSLLSTKVTAIRELNKSITDAAKLSYQMAKENKAAEETDDKRIMDMYNAFINTPIGSYTAPMAPSNVDLVMSSGTTITPFVDGALQTDDLGYAQYMNNLTPEQRKIQLEGQNVKTCVVFDPDTGHRYFDNFNEETGQQVPGLPVPEVQFLDDLNINMNTGVARNTNLNITYPVVIKRSGPDFSGF